MSQVAGGEEHVGKLVFQRGVLGDALGHRVPQALGGVGFVVGCGSNFTVLIARNTVSQSTTMRV